MASYHHSIPLDAMGDTASAIQLHARERPNQAGHAAQIGHTERRMQRRGRGAETQTVLPKSALLLPMSQGDNYNWQAHLMLAHKLEEPLVRRQGRPHKLVSWRSGPHVLLANPVNALP